MAPPLRGEGISESVGFILILAVIIMTISIYLLYLMPAMGRENEIAQMSAVKERFTEYKLNIDTLWTSRQCTSDFGPALSLGSGDTTGILSYFPFFSPPKAAAILALNQRAENITITSDSYFTVSSGGYNESRAITSVPFNLNVNTTPDHFYINISTTDLQKERAVVVDGPTWDLLVNITPNFFYYNRFNLTLDSHGYITSVLNWTEYQWNSTDITVNTFSGASPVVSNLPVYRNIGTSTIYSLDLMSPVYGIATRFQSPQSISVKTSDGSGLITASYDIHYGFAPMTSGTTLPLGAIEYRSNNLFYTPQTYYYQLGGVFLEQSDGSTNEVPPAISISVVNGSPLVNVGEILLQGGVASTDVSGSGPITISSAVTDINNAPLISGNNTRWVNLSIQAASINASEMWNRTFQNLVNSGGLSATSYTIGRSGNVAFLNITGNPQLYDVRLSLTQVNVSADYVEEYSPGGISRSWRNVPGYSAGNPFTLTTTTTVLGASTSSSVFGDPVVFTATVIPTGSPTLPIGTVTFYDGAAFLGTAGLSSGSASLTNSTLPVGVHTITATYSGDSNYGSSTSNVVSVTVSASLPGHVPWYDCSWHYRKNITIDKTKVSGTQANFPVLINFASDSDLQTKAQGNGNDILFTDSGGTFKIPHEIESYTSGTGALVAWVKVSSIQSSANTSIFMYYGNPSAPSQEDETSVWDAGFKAVWHLREIGVGAAGEFRDSTSNGNNGQGGQAGANPPTQVNAQIGYGQAFDSASNQFIRIPDSASLQISGPLTIEGWMKGDTWDLPPSGTHRSILGRQFGAGSVDSYLLTVTANGAASSTPNGFLTGTGVSGGAVNTGTWYHLAMNFTPAGTSSAYLFVNGANVANTPACSISIDANPVIIGGQENDASSMPTQLFDGTIDEVRVSNVARSDTWIKTEYNNQNSPTSFEYRNASESHSC
jgi:hypothetical protein